MRMYSYDRSKGLEPCLLYEEGSFVIDAVLIQGAFGFIA